MPARGRRRHDRADSHEEDPRSQPPGPLCRRRARRRQSVADATNTISDIIGAGIIPGALEMLDQLILKAIEAAFHFGFPPDAGAVLIMEVDGLEAGLDADAERIVQIAKKNNAREVRRAT